MAKYAPKHLEPSGSAEPRHAFAGHKTARLAVTAATTIAMTGSSLLAPFSAFANDANDTTAQDAIMSPLAVHAGEAAGSAVKTNAQKIADLQAAIDAAKAAEAEAKSDYDTAAAPYTEKQTARNNAQAAYDASVSDNSQAEAAVRAEYARQLDESVKAADSASATLKDAQSKLDTAKADAEDKTKVLDAAKQAAADAQAFLRQIATLHPSRTPSPAPKASSKSRSRQSQQPNMM